MGLEVLIDNIPDSGCKGVVADLTDACNTAVGILNDLLLYDKIEEGEVRLEKQVIVAKPFLIKCIQMFVVPVRSYIYIVSMSCGHINIIRRLISFIFFPIGGSTWREIRI